MPLKKGRKKRRKSRRPQIRTAVLLPPCEGPKLHQFAEHDSPLEFVQILTDPDSDVRAHVFEVLIAAKSYALKIFKYYDDEEDDWALWGSQREKAPIGHLDYYLDPFFNECRAYGRLTMAGLNGKDAVGCHGYLMLPAKAEQEIDDQFGEIDWNRPDVDLPVLEQQPLKAIVKDLITDDTAWSPKVARKILKDLKEMRREGVYAMDVKPNNYKGGLLVDFSIALTEPHFLFDIKPPFQVRAFQNEDLIAFDAMVQDKKIRTPLRAFQDMDTMRKLRSYQEAFEADPDDQKFLAAAANSDKTHVIARRLGVN
ncbi:MAG: hypothetical protein Q9170_005535 [Blastenia crenularia]